MLKWEVASRTFGEGAVLAGRGHIMSKATDPHPLLVVCDWCHRFRHALDPDRWLAATDAEPPEGTFSHGICPDCHQEILDSIRGGSLLRGRGVK